MKHSASKIHAIVTGFVGLLLVACSTSVFAQPSSGASSTPNIVLPTAMPLRDTPPVSKNQPAHSIDFPELGMGITLPPDWNILKQPGVVLAGPGLTADNSMERTWLHLSSNADVPQTLAELTQVMTDGMRTVGHIKQLTTTRIIVGEIEGIAIWWTQPNQSEHWLSVHVPAHGIVHEIVFHPLLLSPDGTQLKSAGQAILDSIRFTPTSISSSTSQATIAKIPFGLNIEEHALKDKPALEPLAFEPVNGTQQEILRKHAVQRSERVTNAPSASQRSLVSGGNTFVANVVQSNLGRDAVVELSRNSQGIYTVSVGNVGPVPALWGL